MSDGDSFELYDLKVQVVGDQEEMVCSHHTGQFFLVRGENLEFGAGQRFSLYALAALLPLLPAKQRASAPNDWMLTDHEVACPDPHCGAKFRITRIGKSTFRHSEVSAGVLCDKPEKGY